MAHLIQLLLELFEQRRNISIDHTHFKYQTMWLMKLICLREEVHFCAYMNMHCSTAELYGTHTHASKQKWFGQFPRLYISRNYSTISASPCKLRTAVFWKIAQDSLNWLYRRFFASWNMLLDLTLQNKVVSVRLECTYLKIEVWRRRNFASRLSEPPPKAALCFVCPTIMTRVTSSDKYQSPLGRASLARASRCLAWDHVLREITRFACLQDDTAYSEKSQLTANHTCTLPKFLRLWISGVNLKNEGIEDRK